MLGRFGGFVVDENGVSLVSDRIVFWRWSLRWEEAREGLWGLIAGQGSVFVGFRAATMEDWFTFWLMVDIAGGGYCCFEEEEFVGESG